MKFNCNMHRTEHRNIEIEADDIRQALVIAKAQRPEGFELEDIESESGDCDLIVGVCEGCGVLLLESDHFGLDEEGLHFCGKCFPDGQEGVVWT